MSEVQQSENVSIAEEIIACLPESTNGDGRKYSVAKGKQLDETWDGEYLEKLETKLAVENRLDLAREVRLRRNEMDERLAAEIIACLPENAGGGSPRYTVAEGKRLEEAWDGGYLEKLEKRLAADGRYDLARELRLRRNEMDEARAVTILSSTGNANATPDKMLALAKRLADNKSFGRARRVLRRARNMPTLTQTAYPNSYVEIFQKSALYTYKDPDLPVEWRLDEALRILGVPENLSQTHNRETLGLAGAIHKRKWEADGHRKHLGQSLASYLRGYAEGLKDEHVAADLKKANRPAAAGPDATLAAVRADVLGYLRDNPECVLDASGDQGFNGINAAFILDLLARLDEDETGAGELVSEAVKDRRESASRIRKELIRSVVPLVDAPGGSWLARKWWYYATVGEAYFGLGLYDKAKEWLVTKPEAAGLTYRADAQSPAGFDIPEWEFETTARQLARLARVQCGPHVTEEQFEESPAGRALKDFLRGDEKAVGSAFRGKFGLGLSGGGFRASLYHIGVLARLAELDVLRHVEVLSCVSGGSIIGAHYYLEVRKLLQTTADDRITAEHYVKIVEKIQRDFLLGVQRNIRMRVIAGWVSNVKMIFWPGYSRTRRVGELYEDEIFSRVEDEHKGGPRWLNELLVHPQRDDGTPQRDFKPRSHNWRRDNKVPDLVLNAATLNTGHNWQFTASFMGEPPTPINRDIDCNYRLRRMYYRNAPGKHKQVRLGHAVAASSCVPGLFEPLILDGLYPYTKDGEKAGEPISVRLVDGGACDNQGVMSLREQDCTVMLISDGSGQMDTEDEPSAGVLGAPLRTNSILQARIREEQYAGLVSRRNTSLLRGLMFVHLRQDLLGRDRAWKECPPEYLVSDFGAEDSGGQTSYLIAGRVQQKLSAIRTDLDSFNDAEAYALMLSGYRMTKAHFESKHAVPGFTKQRATGKWDFAAKTLVESMEYNSEGGNAAGRKHLEKVLDTGSSLALKAWTLSPFLRYTKWTLGVVAAAAVLWLFYDMWQAPIIPPAFYEWMSGWLTFKWVAITILTIVAVRLVVTLLTPHFGKQRSKYVVRALRWKETLKDVVLGLFMSTIGFAIARIHVHVFDRSYLKHGKLDKFPREGAQK